MAVLARSGRPVPSAWQRRAWQLYGDPSGDHPGVGVFRYAVGFMAQQVARLNWDVTVDGRMLEPEQSADLIGQAVAPGQPAPVVTEIVTNFLVAGQFWYLAQPERDDMPARWEIVSTARPDAAELIRSASTGFEVLWPHPADRSRPDPPTRGVLDDLQELWVLQRLSRAQARNRMASLGLWLVANEFEGVTDPKNRETFEAEFRASAESAITDPDDAAQAVGPILFGAAELVTGTNPGVAHVQQVTPYDDRLQEKMRFVVEQIANGFPLPREVLLGMTATNRATAFQIEDSAYRAHIEPIGWLVAELFEAVLNAMSRRETFGVSPNPADLLARRHSVADAFDAFDRGLVSAEWVREVIGVPDDAAAGPDDLALLAATRNVAGARVPDPTEAVTEDAVVAAPAGDLDSFAEALTNIDRRLRAGLFGAATMAVGRAMARLGAQVRHRLRNDPDVRARLDGVENLDVTSTLGAATVLATVDVEASLRESLEPVADWWRKNADEAATEIAVMIEEEVPPEFSLTINRSAGLLVDRLVGAVLDSLEDPTVPHDLVDDIIAAGGGEV